MRTALSIGIGITLAAVSGASVADGYKCFTKDAVQLTADGGIESTAVTRAILSSNVDGEFVVDAKSGRIIGGGGILNWNDGTGAPKVIDRGSSEQSFKALTIHGPTFVSVDYLQIDVYESGPDKPFLFLRHGTMISGTCRSY